jgi:hypothetical protein
MINMICQKLRQHNIQEDLFQEAVDEVAKQLVAVPIQQENDCTQEQVEQVPLDLFLFLCLFFYLAVEEEEVQPAAVPNEEEGGCTEVVVVEQ